MRIKCPANSQGEKFLDGLEDFPGLKELIIPTPIRIELDTFSGNDELENLDIVMDFVDGDFD